MVRGDKLADIRLLPANLREGRIIYKKGSRPRLPDVDYCRDCPIPFGADRRIRCSKFGPEGEDAEYGLSDKATVEEFYMLSHCKPKIEGLLFGFMRIVGMFK